MIRILTDMLTSAKEPNPTYKNADRKNSPLPRAFCPVL